MGATPAPVGEGEERLAAGQQVHISVPAGLASPFEYGPSSPAMIYAMPPQAASGIPSGAAVAAYPALSDEDSAPLLADPALEAKLDKKLRRKMKKWLKKVERDHKEYAEVGYSFKNAPLLERIPFYLSMGILASYLFQFIYLCSMAFPGRYHKTSIVLGIQHFFLIGCFIAQAVLSYKLRFTMGLAVVGVISAVFSGFMAFLALLLSGPSALFGGVDFVIVSVVLQCIWLHLYRINRKNRAASAEAATPAAPISAV